MKNYIYMFLRSLLLRLGLLKRFNFNGSIRVNGRRFAIPVINGVSMGYSEGWMLELLKRLQPVSGSVFVDVGVNMGQTLVKVQSVFENPEYLGFEPNAACVHYVQKLVAVNGFANCNVIPAGISGSTGIIRLNYYYDNEDDQSASIVEGFRPGQAVNHFRYVPVFSGQDLQALLPAGPHPLMKVDVEGAELEVLTGLSLWIQQYKPVIIIEILPVYNEDNTFRLKRQQMLETLLDGMGYKMARIDKRSLDLHAVEGGIGVHSSIEMSDYLLYHASDAGRLAPQFKFIS